MIISLFGHRDLCCKNIKERLTKVLQKQIEQCSNISFLIGSHGDFDNLALFCCRELKKSYPQIKITIVFTNLNILTKHKNRLYSTLDLYKDVQTMLYDIENVHFKNQIIVSNKKMVDDSNLIICYVNMNKHKSGAKRAILYAIKQSKPVINLYSEQDEPTYGMTKEEIEKFYKKLSK